MGTQPTAEKQLFIAIHNANQLADDGLLDMAIIANEEARNLYAKTMKGDYKTDMFSVWFKAEQQAWRFMALNAQ